MRRVIAISLAILLCLVFPLTTLADVGPKPTIRIKLYQNGQPFYGDGLEYRMLNCTSGSGEIGTVEPDLPGLAQPDLSDPTGCIWHIQPMPYHAESTANIVSVSGYLPNRFRFAVYSAAQDRLWFSNPADLRTLYATYTLELNNDGSGLLALQQGNVLEKSWSFPAVLAALLLSLLIEIAAAIAYSYWRKLPRSGLILAAAIGSIITLPVVWLLAGFGYLFWGQTVGLLLLAAGEFVAVFIEAIMYLLIAKLRFGWALLLSLIANILSFTIGLLLH